MAIIEPVWHSVPQLERCCQGGKISVWGAKNFGWVYFPPNFSVDLQKKRKKGHLAKLVYFSQSFLQISEKIKKIIS